MKEQFTIGIEEEFQIVDPHTRELRSHLSQMLAEGRMLLQENIKPELHQSVVEVGTGICRNIREARESVTALRRGIAQIAAKNGLCIVAAGTHPFSDWRTQEITEHERYKMIIDEMGDVARANLIFGLHVHVGIEDRETAIALCNQMRYFLPHILALSTSSPFWLGRRTGLKSTRAVIFRRFPRTGIPDYFASWADFEHFVQTLVKTNCIDNGKKIWWDIRPHAFFNTIEIRICDIPTNLDTTIAIAALIQATVAKLWMLHQDNMSFRTYRPTLIEENKWRAARYGVSGKLIDFGKQAEVPFRDLLYEYIRFVDEAVEELDSRHEINYLYRILEVGTSADRQLQVYEESNHDLTAVMDHLIRETMEGIKEGG
ncbi:carboxylate-amine ligase [candidate division KSB1 bacterium]|nr:carboxylate-amine ligase [bacterium]NUM64902.1 carboxylate-amine ligase [candidate division KSB1 bacterium]